MYWGTSIIYTPPPTVFLRTVATIFGPLLLVNNRELQEPRGLSGSHILCPGHINTNFFHFLISYWIMSPTVDLTFPISYMCCLLTNIKAEFQWKVWKHKLFYIKCLWISYLSQIFNFNGSSVIYLSFSKILIWTHQRQFGLNYQTTFKKQRENQTKEPALWGIKLPPPSFTGSPYPICITAFLVPFRR
jgi:hypothetical protein